jgi:hypothetical protein
MERRTDTVPEAFGSGSFEAGVGGLSRPIERDIEADTLEDVGDLVQSLGV